MVRSFGKKLAVLLLSVAVANPCGNMIVQAQTVNNDMETLANEQLGQAEEQAIENIVKSGACGEDVQWSLASDGTLTIKGNGAMSDYTTEHNYYTGITTNVPWGDYLNNITKVVINGKIDYIGKCAFTDCPSIKQVILPSSIEKIGESAFERCAGLSNISFPNKLISIGDYAFRGCSGLISVVIPDSVTDIGGEAFRGCINLESVLLSSNISEIKYDTFSSCTKLVNIEIPQSVTKIGLFAFSFCESLTELEIPEAVEYIATEAFMDCLSLEKIVVKNANLVYGDRVFKKCPDSFVLYGKKGSTSETYAEKNGCKFSVIEPDEDQIIRGECGENVNYELDLSTGVMRIYGSGAMKDYGAYSDMAPWSRKYSNDIVKVKIEDGVTRIGSNAFRNCGLGCRLDDYKNLISIEISETVTEIGEGAFLDSRHINSIVIPDSVITIESHAFFYCNQLSDVRLGKALESIGSSAFKVCPIEKIEFPKSLKSIEGYAFSGCPIEKIEFPSQLVLQQGCFLVCNKLKEVTIADGCEVHSEAFSSCSGLETVNIGKDCKLYGRVFFGCSSLKDLHIGEGSKSLREEAEGMDTFRRCTSLQSVLLPNSWENIPSSFYECTNMKDVQFNDTNMKYKTTDNIVYSKDGKKIIYYPPTLTATEFEIPESVVTIGSSAFAGQRFLEHIIIPSSICEIESWAFSRCSKLNNVIIPESIEKLNKGVFAYCESLNTIVIPASVNYIVVAPKALESTFLESPLKTIYGEKDAILCDSGEEKTLQEWISHYTRVEECTPIIYCYFQGNGGTVESEKKPVIYGDKYYNLPIPVRNGYHFMGWFTDSGVVVTSDTVVTSDFSHTLYAYWEKEEANDIAKAEITLEYTTAVYDGTDKQPAVTIKSNGSELKNEEDFIVVYSNNKNAGTAKAKIYGIGRFSGSIEREFQINRKPIYSVYVASIKNATYTGKPVKPSIILSDKDTRLKNGTDYIVSYKNNKAVGRAAVSITGKGNYEGTISRAFLINPKASQISKLTAKSKSFTMKWKKQTAQVTGYQIQYATNKNFSGATTKIIKKNTTVSATYKKLKAKKKYFVHIRTYKTVSGLKYYSAWSPVKTIITKK